MSDYFNGIEEGKIKGFREGYQKGYSDGFRNALKKEKLSDDNKWTVCKICGRGSGPDLYCCPRSDCPSRITSFRPISSSPYSDVHGGDYTDYKNK